MLVKPFEVGMEVSSDVKDDELSKEVDKQRETVDERIGDERKYQ
jgi:hypothetical protein